MCVAAVSPSLVRARGDTCWSAGHMGATGRAPKVDMLRQARDMLETHFGDLPTAAGEALLVCMVDR